MPQLTIPYDNYLLTIDHESSSLNFQLSPNQSSTEPSFIYVSKLHPQNIDGLLKLLFSTPENLWVYLTHHKERGLSVDMLKVYEDNCRLAKEDMATQQKTSDQVEADLPISIKLIMLEGIGTSVNLKGFRTLQSLEGRLQKANTELLKLKAQIERLKKELNESHAKLTPLQEENQELKRKLEHYERDQSRSTDQVLPKKRVHVSDDHYEQSQKTTFPSPVSNIVQNSMILEASERRKAPQTSKVVNLSQESSPSQSNSSEHDEKNDSMNSNSSSKRSKRNNGKKVATQEQKIVEQEHHKIVPESVIKDNDVNNMHIDKSFDDDYYEMNSYSMVNDNSFSKKTNLMSNHREKLLENDQVKLIKNFVEKCLTQVGFTEKGQAKTGYVCVFCEKIFKQPEFLNKHIHSRHQEVLESHVNEVYLMGKLNSYRMGREAAYQAQLRNKSIEKLKNKFMDNGGR